jgi:hypothetical protein
LRAAAASIAGAALLAPPQLASAQHVFSGDPVDSATSRPYPLLPGVPLILPGPDEKFGTGDDVVNTGIVGDVDLVVRAGTIASGPIPPPAGAVGGPSAMTTTAGGGMSGQGAETPFTVLVSDGAGSPPYGSTITMPDLDGRPVTVFAFGDLDGDGIIGPTNADGSSDNSFERQEAQAYVGRQVGQIGAGRSAGSLGVHAAAPASIGGLRVALVAGVYTGATAQMLFSDGTPIFTRWPFFPPLDPSRVIDSGNPPPPDPDQPIGLQFDIERNYLPSPGNAAFGTPFAVRTDGAEPTTDQFVSVSGPAHGARFFDSPLAQSYRSRSRSSLLPAPDDTGATRVLVLPIAHVSLGAQAGASRTVRLLPVDLLGNVADPSPAMTVQVQAIGDVAIAAPDADADPTVESLVLDAAKGVTVTLESNGAPGDARIDVTSGERIFDALAVTIGGSDDRDGDTRADDGNASTIETDRPCEENDGPGFACDDNCALTANADQTDSDMNGLGDCCDGTCAATPAAGTCGQCVFVGPPPLGGTLVLEKIRVHAKPGDAAVADRLDIRARLRPTTSTVLQPDLEAITLEVVQGQATAYIGSLASLPSVAAGKPRFEYTDGAGQFDGITHVMLKTSASGSLVLRWRAQGIDLVALSANPIQLVVQIGDDVFSGAAQCRASKKTSCKD